MPDTKHSTRPKYRVAVEEVEEEKTPKELVKEDPHEHTVPAKHEATHSEDKLGEAETSSKPKEILLESEPEPRKENTTEEMQEWLANMDTKEAEPRFVKPKTASGGMGKYFAILLIIIILAALGGGIYYYNKNVGEEVAQNTNPNEIIRNEEPQTGDSPTPTPTVVAIDLSKYKVQVLNGAGVSGEASKAQTYLQTGGFKDVKTGNAGSFNFTNTEVSLKKDVPEEVFTKVKSALEPYYMGVVKSDKVLDDKSPYDVVVTVGKRK